MQTTLESATVLDALTSAIEAAPLNTDPCAHIRMENIFDQNYYLQMVEHLPAEDLYDEQVHKDALLPDGRYARLRFELEEDNIARLNEPARSFWRGFLKDAQNPAIEQAYRQKFRSALSKRFGADPSAFETVMRPVLFRDIGGYKISIHADNLDKVITSQLYLPLGENQAHLGTSFHRRLPDKSFEKVKTLPFTPNSGYAFAVTNDSWHSVEQMRGDDKRRDSLMMIWYLKDKPSKLQKIVSRVMGGS